jgi:anaerobic magnesium-protoporphyrin IX monomethyl ester cyclase
VVGISVPFQLRAAELLGVAEALRARGFAGHITVGGHFATFEYENLLRDFPGIDSVVRHEGEVTFRELCTRVRDGLPIEAMPGLVIRGGRHGLGRRDTGSVAGDDGGGGVVVGEKRPLPPLDTLPFPIRGGEAHDILGVRCSPLVGSRGCYADCSFCCIYAYAENARGARYRMRSPENIVAEMKAEYHERGVRLFVFHDDNFFVPYLPTNLKRYRHMAELLRAEGMDDIALVIKCRPNDVDEELFRLLKSMGMIRAYVGIETNSDEGIVSLNRRISSDDNRRALRILRALEIYHSFNVLIFDPEAKLDGVEANLRFMEEFADTPFNFCRAEVYAGTPLKSILELERRLTGNYLAWGYQMRDARVELLFRISSTAFMARNFKPDGVANLNMGLRFDGEMFRRFYPQAWDRAFHDRLQALSRAVGESTTAYLREALAFVCGVGLGDGNQAGTYEDTTAVKRFTLDLARRVARADLKLLGEMKELRREMEGRIRAVGGHGLHNRYGRNMPAWAAESARLGSSVGLEVSTELLPAPGLVA